MLALEVAKKSELKPGVAVVRRRPHRLWPRRRLALSDRPFRTEITARIDADFDPGGGQGSGLSLL
jgi:hypothetical protein